MRLLLGVVIVSGIYDVLLGGALLFALEEVRQLFGTEPPRFPIHANLNGLFALAVGLGYFAILRNLEANRWYIWIMGPVLKGGGALLFVLDFLLRDSPPLFLVFAAADGVLAAVTLAVLLAVPRHGGHGGAAAV
ncbi:MAG: hypothetical protein F4Y71_10295 [Acidobacteria bacterium]|nr:hypothetical protein [Acidobacteriota bacterium]MYG76076.1 hypothetical protein [Acidobacteriota bacterium]